MTHQFNPTGSRMGRSQSATRIRQSVDHSASEFRRKSVAQPQERSSSKPPPGVSLQVQDQSPIIAHRRGSSIRFQNSPKPGSSPSCRSKSLKSPSTRRNSKIPSSPSGSNIPQENNTEHRIFNYSLSVPGDESEFHRLRNFSITSKGVVNRGDSFRCKSSSTSRSSSPKTPPAGDAGHLYVPESSEPKCLQESGAFSSDPVTDFPTTSSAFSESEPSPRYKVWIMGLAGVGKTSLKLQFMTSEYICQYDNWKDENIERNITIVLDNDEFELEITEWSGINEKIIGGPHIADAFIVVYSVANRRSYVQAKQILSKIEPVCSSKAVILVGNKTDLARLRTVNTIEGRSLAKEWGCKFIETSVAINHQVDELLVGIITQIRIREKLNEKHKLKNGENASLATPTRRNKATGIIKRLWRKTCLTNKSCDNLHCV